MKKLFIAFSLFIAFTIASHAQIPNNGFENWTANANGISLDGWWCSNDSINPDNTYFPVSRSTDHYPLSLGSYSIRLESNSAFHNWEAYGLAYPGAYREGEPPAFPVTGHPMALRGYYKYFPTNGDQMSIRWILYKNGGTVTGGEFTDGTEVTEWTSFNIPIVDNAYDDADSARITLSAFNWNGGLIGNSVLYVDNLSFDNLLTTGPGSKAEFRGTYFSPNPATDFITLNAAVKANSILSVSIYDALGNLYSTILLKPEQRQIDLSSLKSGLYILEIRTRDAVKVEKLIVKR
ncbi:MAG: T9SS type A sorting domain-containing protein [Bacteroidales bacterium]|nr:T9SS type A sorting domain-containing protein [Bacteroidales bacterium]